MLQSNNAQVRIGFDVGKVPLPTSAAMPHDAERQTVARRAQQCLDSDSTLLSRPVTVATRTLLRQLPTCATL